MLNSGYQESQVKWNSSNKPETTSDYRMNSTKLLNPIKPLFVSKAFYGEQAGEQMLKDTIAKQKQIAQKGDLNNWDYCNPKNIVDELPQPYKFIDKLLNDMIFQPVNQKIFEIEKTYKSDLNYEGSVSELPPQGTFEINGISAMNSNPKTKSNTITVGDRSGNIFILDLNKKTQICKKDVAPSKRIIHLSSQTITYGDSQLMTISVIARADPCVYIYRYLTGENRLYHHHNIVIPAASGATATNNIPDQSKYANSYPYQANVSINGDFIAISTYNGDVHIYQIPDPPQIPKSTSDSSSQDESTSQLYGSPLLGNSSKRSNYSTSRVQANTLLEQKPLELIEKPFYSVFFQGVKVQPTYQDIVEKIAKDSFNALNPELVQQQLLEQQAREQAAAKEKKDVKKDTKKGGKDQQVQQPTEQELQEQMLLESKNKKKEILLNEITPLPEYIVSASGQDISEDIAAPEFEPLVRFLKTNVSLPDPKKLFSKQLHFEIVSDVLIAWKNVKTFETHHLRPAKKEYLVSALYDNLQREDRISSTSDTKSFTSSKSKNQSNAAGATQQQPKLPPPVPLTQQQLRNLLPPLKPTLTKSFSLIYPITCLNTNESESFAGFGLKDGTVIVWDLHYQIQKWALDRHVEEVTCLDFLENWRLVSGSKDGSVHLHDLEKGKMMMKRTNVFMEKRKNEIKAVSVSDSGLAFALDSCKNLRVYDLWHGQKIAKLQASSHLDDRTKSWTLFPNCLLNAKRDQLCIVTDIHPDLNEEEKNAIDACGEIEKIGLKREIIDKKVKTLDKNTNISIFRIYDILINIFPGLANVSRRGIEREKLLNLFGHLSLENLNDPNFEVPLIGPPQLNLQSNTLDLPQQKNSRSNSKGLFPSILKNKSGENSLNESSMNAIRLPGKGSSSLMRNSSSAVPSNAAAAAAATGLYSAAAPKQNLNSKQQLKVSAGISFDTETDLNSSFRTQLTHATHIKAIPHATSGKQTRLTKETLHPERFLLEKIKIPGQKLQDPESETITVCRKRFDDKDQRETQVTSGLAKFQAGLEKNEEIRFKTQKDKQLRQTTAKKSDSFKRSNQPVSNKTSYL